MRLFGWFIVGLLAGPATAYAVESKHEKDVRECKAAPPVMKHPGDLKKAKQDAFNTCMKGRGYAAGKIRAK